MHIYGGNPNVLISDPCITNFTIDDKSDFILIGCKNIFFIIFFFIFLIKKNFFFFFR